MIKESSHKDEDYNVAEYIVADSSTEAYTFTGDDFVDYTGSAVKYKKDGKIKNISLNRLQIFKILL